MKGTRRRWDALGLGQCFDREIADKLGVHISNVIRERQKRNISPYQSTLGRTARAYPIDWSIVPLGTKTDDALGKELGVSGSCVRRHRLNYNIPSFKEKHIVTDWSRIPLGQVPDWVIAEKLGKSIDVIAVARSARGIPPYAAICKTTEGEPCNAPEGMIDLYWHENNIHHIFQVRFNRFIADWVIQEDTVVEFSGWERHPRYGELYRARLKRKKIYYQKLGYKVLIINAESISKFTPKGTPEYTRVCASCRKPVGRFERGRCKVCYKREYLRPRLSSIRQAMRLWFQND
jgi:hypothetical protein